jgi:hypothetical protein
MSGATMSRALVLLEPPSGAARPRAARRFGTPIFAIFAMLVPLVAFAQQPQVFYAVGSDGQSKSNALYEVDRAIFRAVRSVDVGSAQSGMLSANGRMIVLGDGEFADSTLLQVSAPELVIKNQLDLDTLKVRGADCFDHIFVHPVTNLAYFSCDFGRGETGSSFWILSNRRW